MPRLYRSPAGAAFLVCKARLPQPIWVCFSNPHFRGIHFYFLCDIRNTKYLPCMKGETGERWRKLCEQAAVEQDPDKVLELANEINRLLDEKERRLRGGYQKNEGRAGCT